MISSVGLINKFRKMTEKEFTELANKHLVVLESYELDKDGNTQFNIFGLKQLYEAINYSCCCETLKDKEENNIEIKTLGDLKRAYPEGRLHTVNGYGKIINYSVDGEIVYTRHL